MFFYRKTHYNIHDIWPFVKSKTRPKHTPLNPLSLTHKLMHRGDC